MAAPSGNILPNAENCIYTECYCEENVWKLCEYIKRNNNDELGNCYAVFISNHSRLVPIWMQKACKDPQQPVCWDYHVIFLHRRSSHAYVYDLDSRLPYPCLLDQYVAQSFGSDDYINSTYHRFFRIIPAEQFLEQFASDRSHMKKADNTWIKDPPTYPPIKTDESSNNIDEFISMDPQRAVGEIVNLSSFFNRFKRRESHTEDVSG